MKFEEYNISPEIIRSLHEAGFKRPTDIQYKSIPPILKGEDVLAIAQTGTGKTAAFAIPVLDILHERKKIARRADGIKCLVMVPTRELAIQITEVFEQLGKNTRVKTFSVFGGVEQAPQIARLETGFDILVATPGRMFDLVSQGYLKLHRVEILILDEADHMLDLGFIKDIQDVMKHLPRNRQTLFFSATINEKIKKLAYSLVNNAIRIQVSPKDPVAKNIDHAVAFVEMDDKRFFLERMVKENPESKILVFVRTKVRAERVMKAMERAGLKTQTIHGDKDQQDRLAVMQKFKTGEVKVLVATDVSARGIDIANVDFVVNYDLPEQAENYVHRVGRTGRGTQKGHAISFCSTEEKPILSEIESFLDKPIKVMEITKTDYHETLDFSQDQSYDLKALLREVDTFENAKKKKGKKK
ncbi:DEAD/DEAH box helicase [Adhaeribacter aerolatus]|uniref:DEAD/DEAH box helicase n=1 Tax=Adhaeribacter aerolatus TaxID=670289 RepID=A0A512AYM5_9BACT|nr:DEAD/DEAH box helicase [Adhaeribacter aerolatus]GEO04818.1 DEAD/DEAH box helicase [Adhaeribacter aerolatus]